MQDHMHDPTEPVHEDEYDPVEGDMPEPDYEAEETDEVDEVVEEDDQ